MTDNWYGHDRPELLKNCYDGNSAIVSKLVKESGLDINFQDEEYGDTAAYLCCVWGYTKCVRILAETGRVDWNKRNKWGKTPLSLALHYRQSDIVEIIVKQPNIDYDIKDKDGVTLTQTAVYGGFVKGVETLAAEERCECWNDPDSDGDTPIMRALKYDKTEIVETLLECPRVDLSCRDKEGWSLVFRAMETSNLGE